MAPAQSDFIVIGGGIAGASAAYALSRHGTVTLLEREEQPGYHTTGRSAALYSRRYRNPLIRGLATASGPFLESPPPGFTEHPILTPRGLLLIAGAGQEEALAAQFDADQVAAGIARPVARNEIFDLAPVLDPDYVAAATYIEAAKDIDVNGLHAGFLRGLRRAGGEIVTAAEVSGLRRAGGRWEVTTTAGDHVAPAVVNAAGAWADEIGALAGASRLGLEPRRRTVATFDPPEGIDPSPWPMVMDAEERFYLKPEAGRLLISPCDETLSPPCDAQPDEVDVAVAVELIERATTLEVRRLTHRWAGLRSFFPDRMPVCGRDPRLEGFVWLAGQGGFGIMTAEALGRAAAAVARSAPLPHDLLEAGITEETLGPNRLTSLRR